MSESNDYVSHSDGAILGFFFLNPHISPVACVLSKNELMDREPTAEPHSSAPMAVHAV